jgi:hypothetical protein
MADLPGVGESPLCEKCSVIRFNDKALGGYETTNGTGESVLAFGIDYPETLKLDYMHHDTLPDLPCLEASAEAGCAFCSALRNATLGLALSKPGRAMFELIHIWRAKLIRYPYGLEVLLAELRVEFDASEPAYDNTLFFYIDCEEGKGRSRRSGTVVNFKREL